MRAAGIDIGSRSIELVVLENGRITETRYADTTFDPATAAGNLIKDACFDTIVATGYGRNLFEIEFEGETVTEIKAHARGVRHVFAEAEAILDIGGQDSKVIRIGESGKIIKFEMNDRCAAGTGKFLEIMARNLGFDVDEFGDAALLQEEELAVNSMCTVFAESEVTSLLARGEDRLKIVRGLHSSVARRAISMLNRVSASGPVVFTGGVANNPGVVRILEDLSGRPILVPENPHMTGALGAALIAADKMR